MVKKLRLKSFVMPTIYVLLVFVFVLTSIVSFSGPSNNKEGLEKIQYVSDVIWSNDMPVMSTSNVMVKPFNGKEIKIGKNYYDYNDSKEAQENSIIFYEGTYIQNSGVDYVSDEVFDVLCVYDGVVIKVEDNEITGKEIEIKHDNNIISIYQSLSDVLVKEGDSITSGQVIAKSGNSKIGDQLGNHLHFEIYLNGSIANPENCYNKKISELIP